MTIGLNILNVLWPMAHLWKLGAAIFLLGYLLLVRRLRYKRYNDMHKKYHAKFEEKTLSVEDAQKIMMVSLGYDMPLLLNYVVVFAFFRTFSIPSISKVLMSTKQIKEDTVSKRYTDTEILIYTWLTCPINGYWNETSATSTREGELDPRAMMALARVNYLHSKYNISNGDFLYTLILPVIDSAEWASKYGWRPLSQLEEYAYSIYWREIGKRMGIHDIPETPEAMRIWSKAYEEKNRRPKLRNKELAMCTLQELFYPIPKLFGLRRWVENLSVCMLDEDLRIAMMQPAQPWYNHFILNNTLRSIAFIQKWILLPRSDSNYRLPVTKELPRNVEDGKSNPRMHPTRFAVRPWYKPESKNVFGRLVDELLRWVNWHSDLPGPSFRSGGYRLEEMGPLKFETMGNEEVLDAAAKLQGCPITSVFSRA